MAQTDLFLTDMERGYLSWLEDKVLNSGRYRCISSDSEWCRKHCEEKNEKIDSECLRHSYEEAVRHGIAR